MKSRILSALLEIGGFILIFALCFMVCLLPAGIYHVFTRNLNIRGDGSMIMMATILIMVIWVYRKWHLIDGFSFKKIPFIIFPLLVPLWLFNIFTEVSILERVALPSINKPDDDFWVEVIGGVLIAPLFEELVFRGILLRRLLQKTSPVVAIVISSICFGLIHINPPQILPATIAGLSMGWVYWRTQSLIPGMFLHFLNNFMVILTGYLLENKANSTDEVLIENYELSLLLMFTTLIMSILIAIRIDRILKKHLINPFPNFQ